MSAPISSVLTSIAMETRFCLTALERALSIATPTLFTSAQGSQFTGTAFAGRLTNAGVLLSRNGRGRVFATIFVEQIWHSVTYEEGSLKDTETVREATERVGSYVRFSTTERLHEALGDRTHIKGSLGKERRTPTPPQSRSVHLHRPLFAP